MQNSAYKIPFAVAYWLDIDCHRNHFYEMCLNSIRSVRLHSHNVPIKLISPQASNLVCNISGVERIPMVDTIRHSNQLLTRRYSKYSIFDVDFSDCEFILFLDADTVACQSVQRVFDRRATHDFVARSETGSTAASVQRINCFLNTYGIELTGSLPMRKFFNTGVFLFRTSKAKVMSHCIKKALLKRYPVHLEYRCIRSEENEKSSIAVWNTTIEEEMAFTHGLVDSDVNLGWMTSKNHGFFWEGDVPGESDIFHTSSQLYDDFKQRYPELICPSID